MEPLLNVPSPMSVSSLLPPFRRPQFLSLFTSGALSRPSLTAPQCFVTNLILDRPTAYSPSPSHRSYYSRSSATLSSSALSRKSTHSLQLTPCLPVLANSSRKGQVHKQSYISGSSLSLGNELPQNHTFPFSRASTQLQQVSNVKQFVPSHSRDSVIAFTTQNLFSERFSQLPSFSDRRRSRAHSKLKAAITETAETEAGGEGNEGNDKSRKGSRSKGSAQLARWARARRIRSGKLELRKVGEDISEDVKEAPAIGEGGESDGESDDEGAEVEEKGKEVYMISDGTGWTADHAVQAALGQFEHCLVDQRCSVDTHLFSQITEVDRLMEIIRQAGQAEALVFFTLADPYMADAAKEACQMLHVPHINILGPITDALQSHLGVSPSGIPRGAPGRKSTLSKQYFKRIEAVEFTIRQDDGALPKNIIQADIVLTGVSRTSKTPLSTYMAQKGYKVANVPLVLEIDPPKELFEVDQDKVYALTINPNYLKSIRLARSRTLGMGPNARTSYSDMNHIRKELEYSSKLFLQNPRWPVVEVTGKAIEETAAIILRIFHERHNKHQMPRISRRY